MKKQLLTLIGWFGTVLLQAQSPVICPTPSVPAADLCSNACLFCNLSGYLGTTSGYTGQTPAGFCGTIENEQWLGFVAGDTAITITCTPSNCENGNGIQLALYPSCDGLPLACNPGASGFGDTPISIHAAVLPGQAYFLLIDGYADDICDFAITVSPAGAATAPQVGDTGPLKGPGAICANETKTFSVTPVPGAGTYLWTAPAGALINGQTPPVSLPAPGGASAQIQFGTTAGTVCVQALNACSIPGNPSCQQVNILAGQPDTTILPPLQLCFEDKPYLLAWGDSAYASGLYQHVYTGASGCDSVVQHQITFRPKIAVDLPPKSLCNGSPITVCGQTFSATGYYSAVCTSASGCDSTVNFWVNGPGANRCVDACMICLNNLSGTTAGFTSQMIPGFCGTIENDQWLSFIAGAPAITIVANASNCAVGHGVQMGLFTACNTAPIACAGGMSQGAGSPVTLSANLTPGQLYYLMVDGYAGDICDFTLNITPTSAIQIPGPGSIGAFVAPDTICTFQENAVSIPPVTNAGTYTWTASDSVLINGFDPPAVLLAGAGNKIQIKPTGMAGSVEVCVEVANACSPSVSKSCKTIPTKPGVPPLTLPVANVCLEAQPYVLPWGDTVKASGFYQHNYLSLNGCDSVVGQQVFLKPAITTNLPLQEICPGDSAMVCGKAFATPGTYTAVCPSVLGCDSTVKFTLQVVSLVAEVIPPTAGITCAQPEVTLSSAASPGTKTWENKLGQVLGAGNNFTTGVPGYYFLKVTVPAGNTLCTAEKLVLVKTLTEPPPVAAKGGTLSKQSPWIVLQATSTFPKVSYAWSGPNGFQSGQQNPIVSVPGIYTVTVTDLTTGCTNSAGVKVIYE